MTKMTVKIWDHLNATEAEATEAEVVGLAIDQDADSRNPGLRALAKAFAEKGWGNSDYPETTELNIRMPSGALVELDVVAEQSIEFRVRPRSR